MGRKEMKDTLESLAHIPDSAGRVILATGRCVGEGFDDSRLDTLFLTLPVSRRGTIAQYLGRLHRVQDRFLPPLRGVDALGPNRGLSPPATFGQALRA